MRHILCLGLLIGVLGALARRARVLRQVVPAAVRAALELRYAERELEHDVGAGARVVRELVRLVLLDREERWVDANADVPREPRLDPRRVLRAPLLLDVRRLDEILKLHLLKLARAEDEVSRRDLVAECLANLRDAEGHLDARARDHVFKVGEDPLCRLRPQVRHRRAVRHRADRRLEHEVEIARCGQRARLAGRGRRDERVFGRVGLGEVAQRRELRRPIALELLEQGARRLGRGRLHVGALEQRYVARVRARAVRDLCKEELVGAEALLGLLAVDHRVGETGDVPRRLPDPRRRDDRRVEPDDVVAPLHHVLPPRALDIVAQLDAKWAIVEEAGEARVDLRRRVDKAAPLAQRHDVRHVLFALEDRLHVGWPARALRD
mmetsp:Transcript_3350/g.10452  ORF Transcript_3350/g.10452 Transcript_3350/m.10452 type:complete len:380 (-) Transcript_3350:66-1205(-)